MKHLIHRRLPLPNMEDRRHDHTADPAVAAELGAIADLRRDQAERAAAWLASVGTSKAKRSTAA